MSQLNPYDPLNRLGGPLGPLAPRPAPAIKPLEPEEENSLLGEIAGKALGGIGYVGSVLEKTLGGRAIRGALAGKPRELLSILPGSDTLGITSEADRTSGKELLGMEHDDSWGATLAGLGTELALDPLMYLSFGGAALTRSGQIARKLGQLPGAVGERATGSLGSILSANPTLQTAAERAAGGAGELAGMLQEPLGGVVGLGLPLRKPAVVLGQGQAGADFMSGLGAVGRAADTTLRSIPLAGHLYGGGADLIAKGADVAGRYASSLFQPEVMGATTHLGQETAREAHAAIRPLVAQHLERAAGYGQTLKEAGLDPTGEVLRGVLEGTHVGPVHPAIQGVADAMKTDFQSTLAKLQALGVDVSALTDLEAGYAPRYMTSLTKPTKGFSTPRQPLVARDPRVAEREEILRGIVGGTHSINRMILDPEVYAQAGRELTPLESAAVIRSKYLPGQAMPLPAGEVDPTIGQSHRLAEWVRGLDPQYRASIGTPNELRFFGNHPLADYADYYQKVARLESAADATQNLLARTASEAVAGAAPEAGARGFLHALEDVGLRGPGAQETALARLNLARAEQGLPALQVGELGNFQVPGSTVSEATRYLRGFSQPDAVNQVVGAYDKLTNLTKAGQTAPWPAFHARNFLSGLWQNWVKGGSEALAETRNAYELVKGGVVGDANLVPGLEHLSPEAATQALAREMYAWGIGGHLPHLAREGVGPSGEMVSLGTDLEHFLARIPGERPRSVGGALSQAVPGSLTEANPLNIAGVASNADLFAPVKAGRELGDVIEGTNRGALYMSLRRQGFTPEQAAKEVIQSHFDYAPAAKTPFEKNVMSRLFPFYTFSRQNLPYVLEQLATNPGGPAGIAARTALSLRQDSGFLPDYLGSGLAVPVGAEEDGMRRYLTRLDLPAEQAFEMLHGGLRGTQNSLLSLMGQVNPLIKAPAEYATGKQFFSGRDIGDLYNMTGSATLDQLLMNSPLSRAATTARTLSDERKWESPGALAAIPLNLLTGAKVSDVDIAKQRNIAEGEYVREALRGSPATGHFETVYPKVPVQQLTPEELTLLRLNKTVEMKAQEAARKKKVVVQ